MNCLEFRRAVLTDPRRLDAAAAAHAGQCAACKEFLAGSLHTEALLVDALRVRVPAGLHARLLERMAGGRRLRWAALAASLLAAAVIAFFAISPRPDPLALAAIDFVVLEEAQSIADAKPTNWQTLLRVTREMGVSLPEELGEMRYVCLYPFSGGPAHHLLVKTPHGKVTLLLIPDRAPGARTVASARGLEALIAPALKGGIAIVGDSWRSIQRVESLLTPGRA